MLGVCCTGVVELVTQRTQSRTEIDFLSAISARSASLRDLFPLHVNGSLEPITQRKRGQEKKSALLLFFSLSLCDQFFDALTRSRRARGGAEDAEQDRN